MMRPICWALSSPGRGGTAGAGVLHYGGDDLVSELLYCLRPGQGGVGATDVVAAVGGSRWRLVWNGYLRAQANREPRGRDYRSGPAQASGQLLGHQA